MSSYLSRAISLTPALIPAGNLGVVTYERITTDPGCMGGMPCIRDLRFPVATVVAMVADGVTSTRSWPNTPTSSSSTFARPSATHSRPSPSESSRYAPAREIPARLEPLTLSR